MNILKNKVIDHFAKETYNFIVKQYPEWKQFSDQADMNFWTSWLVNYANRNVDEINQLIYSSVSDVMDGTKTFENVLNDIAPLDDDHLYEWRGQEVYEQIAWEQIGKASIRQGWMQIVKSIYAQYEYKLRTAENKEDLKYTISLDEDKPGIYPLLSAFFSE